MRKYKNIIKGVFSIGIGWIACKIREEIRNVVENENKNNLISRQEEVLKVYEAWINKYQNSKLISDYLFENKYYKIAIYGLGRLGKHLCNEIISSKLTLSYVIDQKYSVTHKLYNQIPCYHPEDILPQVDLIIVTVPSDAREIIEKLRKKIDCPIESINEVLFVMD